MSGKLQIIISSRANTSQPLSTQPLGFWRRFKLLIIGFGILMIAAAVLVIALILGSIVVAVLWACLVLAVGFLLIRTVLKRIRS